MKFWPSGIQAETELAWARKAGSLRILISCFNAEKHWTYEQDWIQERWIDSDAFAYFQRKEEIRFETFVAQAKFLNYDWITAPDRIGNPAETKKRMAVFQEMLSPEQMEKVVPVWGFRHDWEDHLDELWPIIESAPMVALGGCVEWLRLPNYDAERQIKLASLRKLCEFMPNFFHIFGLHDVGAITLLRDVAGSFDTATWVTKAAKRQVLFIHTTQGGLRRAPVENVAHSLGLSPDISKEDLAIFNLRTLMEFCER